MNDLSVSRRALVAGTLAGSAAAAVSLAGCGGKGEASQGDPQSVPSSGTRHVTVAMSPSSEPAAGFDPLVAWGCGEHVHEPLIQSTLITTDENLNFVNDLAADYYCSTDGLVWTFELRDDVTFSDGEPLTAEDVAFTVNGVIESPSSQADLSMVKKAVAISDAVVELHLAHPDNTLLYTLAVLGIVPKHAYGPDYGGHPIGSGRYLLKQWDRGQQVIFQANPGYYGKTPNFDTVTVVFMDEDAALAAVQAGKVDVAYTFATKANQKVAGYRLVAFGTVDSRGISLPAIPAGGTKVLEGDMAYNAGSNVTCDVAVRRSINMAIDRQALIDNVLNGYGKVAYSVGDGMPWSSDDMFVKFDREGAIGLLEEAGWKPGQDGIRERDGVRAAFDLWYSADDSVRQALAHEFANQMAQIGLEVTPCGGSWDQIYPHQFSSPVLWGWGSHAPLEVYALNHSTGWGNYSCYKSEVTDAYLERAIAQTDVAASYPLWQKAMWDGTEGVAPRGAATWAWLANVDHLYFVAEGLDLGIQKPHPHGHGWSILNNVNRWDWI